MSADQHVPDQPRTSALVDPDRLRAALLAVAADPDWFIGAQRQVSADPAAIARPFAAAGRRCGRAPLPAAPGWTADAAARALLLVALPPEALPEQLTLLYRYGDPAEKLAVLRTLPMLAIGPAAVPLLHDAIRTNDSRLVAAALGPYARHLDAAMWRQAVLKCVFTGVPLHVVDGLAERADAELATMLAGLAEERQAAGRPFPADAGALLHRLTTGSARRRTPA